MNIIIKQPIAAIGYNFIETKYLPQGKNEYYLRDSSIKDKKRYRKLSRAQIHQLIEQNNTADNWDNILVTQQFKPELIKNCKFFGLIRIGDLEPMYHEFHNLRMPEGIYNSTIISCDIGDHPCIDHVKYLSHYIIDKDVMLININELATTDKAKFGNGILKDGETDEKQRMVIEVCNENGGRSIIPFNGMLAGDAFLWSKYRDDEKLLKKFKEITEKKFDKRRGYYGYVGPRTVIKNCLIIKDTWIGSDAYIKGANKLKNITINSDTERKTQIGEGCELVNGIVGFGCRIFYGVKAVRFITASHSQLKYGARLINSYLGNNSTISCCEVLNTMIFPAHEQHHNNSFLCASLVMGQSNIAAGATIGSNHNSRGADGEIIAGRGFWPGLCVSLKHNSKFASFTILAKGDYPAELNIPIPFCLVSQDLGKDRLVVMPGYWFMYNMYALARNAWKYEDRDKRILRTQYIEFDYLAPDTVNEMLFAIEFLKSLTTNDSDEAIIKGWENSGRTIIIKKVKKSIAVFQNMIKLYAVNQMLEHIDQYKIKDFKTLKAALKTMDIKEPWINVGGQLMKSSSVELLKTKIKSNRITRWEQVHAFYKKEGETYPQQKLRHGYSALLHILGITPSAFNTAEFHALLLETINTKQWICEEIKNTRAKDYTNTFRKMVYNNKLEMDKVLGKLEDNSFIIDQEAKFKSEAKKIQSLIRKWKLK